MDQVLQETFLSPGWWISTILVAFVISIIANKATDPVSNVFGRVFARYRNLSEEKRRKFARQVDRLMENQHEEVVLRIDTNHSELLGYMVQGFGMITIVVASVGRVLFVYIDGVARAILEGGWIEISSDVQVAGQTLVVQLFTVFSFLAYLGLFFLVLGVLSNLSLITPKQLLNQVQEQRKNNAADPGQPLSNSELQD